MKNFHIDRINFQEGVVSCRVDLKSMLIKQLLDKYPELIKDTEEEFDKQELLDKAKKDYPIGTVCAPFNAKYLHNKANLEITSDKPYFASYGETEDCIWIHAGDLSLTIYKDGEWAKILPLKFTTEDGVNIYGDMKTYMVYSNLTMSNKNINNEGTNSAIKYFYHKENALAYIKENTQRSLEDYEKLLLDSTVDYSIDKTYYSFMAFYNMLKMKEPKLYYTKVLQLIADDLNDGWVADFSGVHNPVKYFLTSSGWNTTFNIDIPGVVYFKSEKVSSKAKDILGDKVKFLFN